MLENVNILVSLFWGERESERGRERERERGRERERKPIEQYQYTYDIQRKQLKRAGVIWDSEDLMEKKLDYSRSQQTQKISCECEKLRDW